MNYKVQHKALEVNSSKRRVKLNERSKNMHMALNQMLCENVKYVFLGNYPDLPNFFSGNDIDILVTDLKATEKIFRQHGFIFRSQCKNELRAFLYIPSTAEWVAVDIETFGAYPAQGEKILKYILSSRFKDKKTQLMHPSVIGILAYKIMKYIFNGYVHSWHQILELQQNLNALGENERGILIDLLNDFKLCNKTKSVFNLISLSEKEIFSDKKLHTYIDNKRRIRHKERLIYQGAINRQKIFKKPKLLWMLFYNRFFKSKNALPVIALVGNDGSGKTEQCQRLKDELYKLDPLHIIMRGNESWLPGWNRTRQVILNYIKKNDTDSKIKSFSFIIWILAWIGEIGDFIDRLFRYKVGMAWANSGFGFTIFERYPTDRLRGEYPGPKWSLFPIEQYFPMPDLIVLLDVDEGDSLKRKSDDGHTYQEMHEKRENYLRLIDEIRPSVVISPTIGLDEIQGQLSKLIWDYSLIKQQVIETSVKFPAKWAPKLSNKRQGRNKQKNGFL